MRIACSNCGQVMEVAPQMAGQIASCPRCRTNIQIPMLAPGGTPQPVITNVNLAVPGTPGGSFVRHVGRGLGITLGILVLLLLVMPLRIIPPVQGVQGSTVQIQWPWLKAVNATTDQTVEWLTYLVPAMVGVLAVIGAALPSPVRGIFLWLSGLGLLLGAMVIQMCASGTLGSLGLETWLRLLLLPLLFMAVGGHGAAMRRAGAFGARLASGLPTLLFLAALGILIGLLASQSRLVAGSIPLVPGTATQPVDWQGWVSLILGWAVLALLGVSVLLGLINLFAGKPGVGTAGYALAVLGAISLFVSMVLPDVNTLIVNAQVNVQTDYLAGVGGLLHVHIPPIFGLMLVFAGWGSAWKLDRPAKLGM